MGLMTTANWPPRYSHSEAQGPLRRFSATTALRAVPGLSQRFSGLVPDEYWSEEAQTTLFEGGDADGTRSVGLQQTLRPNAAERSVSSGADPSTTGRIAIIDCVCGAKPRAMENKLAPCECERVFLLLGDSVRVARL